MFSQDLQEDLSAQALARHQSTLNLAEHDIPPMSPAPLHAFHRSQPRWEASSSTASWPAPAGGAKELAAVPGISKVLAATHRL